MKKVFGQRVRDLKREVNKTVLKVPRLEQKVLDATSNERWGPHGTLLADVAQATMNFKEYQMIMTVLWKRINDSGKNWRHVYKALSVLDYLVANGSERVIDEVKENAYQLSTLFNFRYIDSKGRDQGINVRQKAQSLVNLVNDKERIIEVRQQAAANREKFYNPTSTDEMGRQGRYGDRYDGNGYERGYGSRDEDKNGVGYGREREYEYRDEDHDDRKRDAYSRDGDRNCRDYEEDLDSDYVNCRRSRSVDDFHRGSTDKSVDRDRVHASDDDGRSSRSSGVIVDDQSQDGKQADKKITEQDIRAPPSYEEAMFESRSPANGERDRETAATPAPTTSSPSFTNSQSTCLSALSANVVKDGVEVCDEFDPRSVSAAPSTSKSADMELLDSLTESFSNPLAIMPAAPANPATGFEPGASTNSGAAPSFSTSGPDFANEMYVNPFGDPPFKAVPSSDDTKAQSYAYSSTEAFNSSMWQSPIPHHGGMLGADTVSNFGFGESFSTNTYPSPPLNPHDSFSSNQDVDILADILPPSQTAQYSTLPSFPTVVGGYTPQMDSITYGHLPVNAKNFQPQSGLPGQFSSGMPVPQGGSGIPVNPQMALSMAAMPHSQINNGTFFTQQGGPGPSGGPVPPSTENLNQHSFPTGADGNLLPQAEASTDNLQTQSGQVGQLNNGMLLPNGGSGIAVNPHMAPPVPGMPNLQLPGPQPSSGLVPPSSGNLNWHSFPSGATGNLLSQAETKTDKLPGQSEPDGQFTNGMILPNERSGIVVNPQMAPPTPGMPNSQINTGSSYNQMGGPQPSVGPVPPSSGNLNQQSFLTGVAGNLLPQAEASTSRVSHHSSLPSTASLSVVSNPSKDKFETKSTVWADTLSRGLVNLNISGPETNPLADIGIDFDSLNRKEKRMEKPSQAPVASTITMGKAMGSGSGMGRTGAGALRAPTNPMMGSHMALGPPGSAGASMAMGGYGGMNQLGMGMGMNMNMNPGMSNTGNAMNIGMGQQPMGIPQGANMSPMVGYNPMMNNPQQPYAGAYSMTNTPQQSYGGGYQ